MAFDFDILKMNMEGSAEWRRRKAEEYPRDAQRNLEAAAVFDKIAETMGAVTPQTRARYEAIIDADADRGSMVVAEVESEITGSIHISYASAEEFIVDVCERAESKLEDDEDENDDDDTIGHFAANENDEVNDLPKS